MTEKCAVTGSLIDIKNINQHKCARLLIDVPAENAARIIEMFGWPTMASPVPVAIARLQTDAEVKAQEVVNAPKPSPLMKNAKAVQGVEARKWETLPYPQRAGIRCADPLFHAFLREVLGRAVGNEDDAADQVKVVCDVESRSDIRPGTDAETKWNWIDSGFIAWRLAERMGAV